MKKSLIRNAIIMSMIVVMLILNFFVLEMIEPGFIYLLGIFVLVEAIVFLYTFIYFKRKTIQNIKKCLIIYCSIITILMVGTIIYERITGYVFIYESYRVLYVSLFIYPFILLVMVSSFKEKVVGDNRGIVVAITSVFVVVFMALHGLISIFSISDVDILENQNGNNTVLVTDSAFLHGTVYEYTQVNSFFMEYEGIYESW